MPGFLFEDRDQGNWGTSERGTITGCARSIPGPQLRGISTPRTWTYPWGPRTGGTRNPTPVDISPLPDHTISGRTISGTSYRLIAYSTYRRT